MSLLRPVVRILSIISSNFSKCIAFRTQCIKWVIHYEQITDNTFTVNLVRAKLDRFKCTPKNWKLQYCPHFCWFTKRERERVSELTTVSCPQKGCTWSLIQVLTYLRPIQTEHVIHSKIGRFNAGVKRAQIENSLSYCINACDLRRSEGAITYNFSPVNRKREWMTAAQMQHSATSFFLTFLPTRERERERERDDK